MKNLWLDDTRPSPDNTWDIARNYDEFVQYIEIHGVPDLISFDYHLGGGYDGYDCAHWLIQNKHKIKRFMCHSSDVVGKKEIITLLKKWKNSCEK